MTSRRAAVLARLLSGAACSQTPAETPGRPSRAASRPDLFACEGCEATAERAPETLGPHVRLAAADEPGERLALSGRVFQADGATPAPGVVLYVHQTDAAGRYVARPGATGWARRHGALRGWLATDAAGRYRVDTVRPGPYPDADLPAHVHVFVKEPGRPPYYVDDVTFEGDPFLTPAYRAREGRRGGSGIVRLARRADGSWEGRRDIVLEP